MMPRKAVLAAHAKCAAMIASMFFVVFSVAANSKEYTIEYGEQYELCHDLVDLLADFPDDADPVCGLPEPPEDSLIENLDWKPSDYSRSFILDALSMGRTLTESEKNEFWTVKKFDENQPDSSVEQSTVQFSPKHSPVKVYKIKVERCELDTFENLLDRRAKITPVFYVPDPQGVEIGAVHLNARMDIFRYDGRYYTYALRSDEIDFYELDVSRHQKAFSRRVCALSEE